MLFSRDLRTISFYSSLREFKDPRSTIRWRIPYGNDGVLAWAIWTSRWYFSICNYLPFKALQTAIPEIIHLFLGCLLYTVCNQTYEILRTIWTSYYEANISKIFKIPNWYFKYCVVTSPCKSKKRIRFCSKSLQSTDLNWTCWKAKNSKKDSSDELNQRNKKNYQRIILWIN